MQDNRNSSRPKGTYDIEALEDLISALLEASQRGAAIIVEGRRDKMALQSLGASGPVIMASSKSILDMAEDAASQYQEIVVLTDWDEKGEEMALLIEQHLRSTKSLANMEIRSRLKRLVKKEIKDVENLGFYVERMRELYGI
jgi:5S rRNA maturation endonuclease (ribonuclease M5)